MSTFLQMILGIARTSFNSLVRVTSRAASAIITPSQQLHKKMSSQSINEKFQLPKRYRGQAPSVWYVENYYSIRS